MDEIMRKLMAGEPLTPEETAEYEREVLKRVDLPHLTKEGNIYIDILALSETLAESARLISINAAITNNTAKLIVGQTMLEVARTLADISGEYLLREAEKSLEI